MKYFKIITYGCQMNVHESEKISGIMEKLGYITTNDDNLADAIIFNTCCVRDNAERKALGNISSYKKMKKARPSLLLIVLGCMTQQKESSENLYKRYPYVDIILGSHNKFNLKEAIESRINNKKRYYNVIYEDSLPINEDDTIVRDSGVGAWVDIMYGCNNFCTYCIVPYVRGREKSRDRQDIISEVKRCLDAGYKEITLLGQNVNSYGIDTGSKYTFPDLLEEIASIDKKFRINYMTSHPKDFSKRVVDIIRDYDNVSNYIHLPIQAGSNKILDLMNRKYSREQYLDTIDYIKKEIPDVGITTDIMVGFPFETEEDFQDTLEVVKRVKYTNAFMFVYSPRKGTPASNMPQIDEAIKKERINRLISLQRKITQDHSKSLIGSIQEVLVEDKSPRFNDMLCGRTYNGKLTHFKSSSHIVGDFAKVKIISNKAASLLGEAIDDK